MRNVAALNHAEIIDRARNLVAKARNRDRLSLSLFFALNLLSGRHAMNKLELANARKTLPPFNTDRLLAELRAILTLDMFSPQHTGRTEAIAELIKHK